MDNTLDHIKEKIETINPTIIEYLNDIAINKVNDIYIE